jgi:hypothetical protein
MAPAPLDGTSLRTAIAPSSSVPRSFRPWTGQPISVITRTVEMAEELLIYSGASLVYAGYPSDPYESAAP